MNLTGVDMESAGFKKYYQAPVPAIIAVLIVYFWQGMGHFVMYMMQHVWFPGRDLIAAFVIGVIGVVYYITSQPKAATTTNIYQPKRDNAWSFGAVVIDRLSNLGLKALNSGGGSSAPTADTSSASSSNKYAGSLTGGGLTLDPMLM